MSKSANPICGIYKIENMVNGKVYIGQSDDIQRRIKTHKNDLSKGKHSNTHLQRSVDKYGLENFSFDIVCICNEDELDEKEIFYIKSFDSFVNGYNQTEGGGGNRGYVVSEESKEKMRASHPDVSGVNNPMYGKKLIDVMGEDAYYAYVERVHELRSEIAKRRTGKPMSKEGRENISKARIAYCETHRGQIKGHKVTKENHEKMEIGLKIDRENNPDKYCKGVVLLNSEEIYESVKSASESTGCNQAMISNCINHKAKYTSSMTTGNLCVFVSFDEYKNMNNDMIRDMLDDAINTYNNRRVSKRSIPVVCVNTGIVYHSATFAGKALGIDNSDISKCCKGKLHYAGIDPTTSEKLVWRFAS